MSFRNKSKRKKKLFLWFVEKKNVKQSRFVRQTGNAGNETRFETTFRVRIRRHSNSNNKKKKQQPLLAAGSNNSKTWRSFSTHTHTYMIICTYIYICVYMFACTYVCMCAVHWHAIWLVSVSHNNNRQHNISCREWKLYIYFFFVGFWLLRLWGRSKLISEVSALYELLLACVFFIIIFCALLSIKATTARNCLCGSHCDW